MVWSRMKPEFTKLSSLACGVSTNLWLIWLILRITRTLCSSNLIRYVFKICLKVLFCIFFVYYFVNLLFWRFDQSEYFQFWNLKIGSNHFLTWWHDSELCITVCLSLLYVFFFRNILNTRLASSRHQAWRFKMLKFTI